MRDEILRDEASVHRNFHLLNDCKITPAFLRLEKRKAGYSSICKITTNEGTFTDPHKIREETSKFYQSIYNKQKVNSGVDDIKKFLQSDNDTLPWETLKSRRISDELKGELEKELTRSELTEALFKQMKPNSAPGIDGFSVLFVREFWSSLVDLVWMALLSMKKMADSLRP